MGTNRFLGRGRAHRDGSLVDKIKSAQVDAGEQMVIRHLQEMNIGAVVAHVNPAQMTSHPEVDKSRPMSIDDFKKLIVADIEEYVRSVKESEDANDILNIDEWMQRYISSVFNI